MLEAAQARRLTQEPRRIETAVTGDDDLGALRLLPGTWKNEPTLPGRGWNMIALPFPGAGGQPGQGPETGSHPSFRLLLNQYNETLTFSVADKSVKNRGLAGAAPDTRDGTQIAVALDYVQSIVQVEAVDSPVSGLAGTPNTPIHHEPGLFLQMSNPDHENGPDIARLGTIPHGTTVLAVGTSSVVDGAPPIPAVNALPVGVTQDLSNPYLAPYQQFHQSPFKGIFDPTDPTGPLRAANDGVDIVRTTVLPLDTTAPVGGGLANTPFIVQQAEATHMQATFFIHEVAGKAGAAPTLRLQYLQVVVLDFLPRADGQPGRIRWPHVSVNTMEKVAEAPA